MSGHVGHQLRLSATRIRPHFCQRLQHEPHPHSHIFNSRIRLSAANQRRNFGGADAVGYLLKGSELLITGVHEVTATPWFISLPLVAVVVSAIIRVPLTLYSQNVQRKKAKLAPLISAQYAQIGLGLRRKAVPNLRERVTKAVKARSKKMFTTFALHETRSIWGGLISLPVFLSNLEVIRTMCGGPRGLLGSLLYGWPGRDGTTPASTTPATPTASTTAPNGVVEPYTAGMTPPTDIGELASSAASPEVLNPLTLEPTFATGGCLWFPDLLAPDPYHILPFAVSGLLLAHIIPETGAELRSLLGMRPAAGSSGGQKVVVMGERSRGSMILRRVLMVTALAIGPVTMDMPVALHLYWASSVGCSLVVTKGIRRLLPIPKLPVKPCRGLEIPLLRPEPN